MCELFGASFNKKVRINFSFNAFRQRGKTWRDGWGLAWYPDESCQIIKEEKPAFGSKMAQFLKDNDRIKSKIFISHVRGAYVPGSGDTTTRYKDTHPFMRIYKRKEYVFAHNGVLHDFKRRLELNSYYPIGNTDSEHAFCHLLGSLRQEGLGRWTPSKFEWVREKLREINELGKFNCVFSDGKYLFCYHDRAGNGTLNFLKRQAPFGNIRYRDDDFEEISLDEVKNSNHVGYLVSTTKLSNESWKDFEDGQLMVFKGGQIEYSST